MLHSFLIISGRGGIVLFRKSLTKNLNKPRLIAGLLTALCKASTRSIGIPVSYLEMEHFAITVVEDSAAHADPDAEYLRCVSFHDVDDGELYGRVIGTELLHAFREEYSLPLATAQLAGTEGAEALFKGFGARIRPAMEGAVRPLLLHLERHVGIEQAVLVRDRGRGSFGGTLGTTWYSTRGAGESSLVADLQGLMNVADDVLASRSNKAQVLTLGDHVRIQRLALATLIVVTQPPHTCNDCATEIDEASRVLQRLFVLTSGLQGSQLVT